MKRRGSGRIALVSSAAGQVGIFGYTGYSASKFALRGFAEALQMEARPYVVAAARHPRFAAHAVCVVVLVSWRSSHNIAVSLAFPPDVNTPMLAEEDKTKPAETKEIAGTVSVQQPGACSPSTSARRRVDVTFVAPMVCADAIAAALISGIRAGRFFINFDLLGNLLGFLSAGFAPTVGIVNNLLGVSYGHCLAATCKWLTCVLCCAVARRSCWRPWCVLWPWRCCGTTMASASPTTPKRRSKRRRENEHLVLLDHRQTTPHRTPRSTESCNRRTQERRTWTGQGSAA